MFTQKVIGKIYSCDLINETLSGRIQPPSNLQRRDIGLSLVGLIVGFHETRNYGLFFKRVYFNGREFMAVNEDVINSNLSIDFRRSNGEGLSITLEEREINLPVRAESVFDYFNNSISTFRFAFFGTEELQMICNFSKDIIFSGAKIEFGARVSGNNSIRTGREMDNHRTYNFTIKAEGLNERDARLTRANRSVLSIARQTIYSDVGVPNFILGKPCPPDWFNYGYNSYSFYALRTGVPRISGAEIKIINLAWANFLKEEYAKWK